MFTKSEQRLKSEHSDEQLTNLFAKKAADIIRVLLVHYPKTWTMRDLAQESGASLGYTSRVSKTLIRQRLALRGSARSELKVMAPADLLKRWATFSNSSQIQQPVILDFIRKTRSNARCPAISDLLQRFVIHQEWLENKMRGYDPVYQVPFYTPVYKLA